MHRFFTILAAAILCWPGTSLRANSDYENGVLPKPPAPFAKELRGYQILPASVSPGGRYGWIYPKRSEAQDDFVYLVALKPFRVLVKIPLGNASLRENAHGDYTVNWADDSSAVVMIIDSKWGPDKVLVVPIQDGKAGKVADLTAAVTKLMQPQFKRAKTEPFNEDCDFIFESEWYNYAEKVNGPANIHESWQPNTRGQVVIACACTTDPKPDAFHSWTMRFDGTWDIAAGRFIRRKLTRLPPPMPEKDAGTR